MMAKPLLLFEYQQLLYNNNKDKNMEIIKYDTSDAKYCRSFFSCISHIK